MQVPPCDVIGDRTGGLMTRYFKGPVQLPYLKKQWKRVSGPVSATDHFTLHST